MLGATGSVKINAAKTVNKTLEADGKQYDDREKTVPTDVEDKLSGNSAAENNPLNQDKLLEIGSLKVSSKIYKLNNDPSAKYLIETNKKYADYLNKLGEIFDKTKVQEKQEFAGMFQEIAHNYLGDLTGKISKEEKAFLNSFVDGLIAQWTSGDFLAGASATAINKLVSGEGLKELTIKINDTIKIDTSHISPSMNIAYDTGVRSYNKVLLKGVSKVTDSVITIGSATYSIYMDATKYSGVSLGASITLDLSTLYFISKGEQWVSSATNTPVMVIKLVSGGTAYLVDEKLTTPMKESIDKRLPDASVIEHRIND